METKKCIVCNSEINAYASTCPVCGHLCLSDESNSSLNLDFFSLSLYQSTIEEITSEYEAKFGKPDKILDTTYFSVGEDHFYHRFIFFGDSNKLVYISPDKHIIIPYSQITGYNISDQSFVTGGSVSATTTTNTGSLLGRTAVGAVVGGATGAIIGGATASKTTVFENSEETVNPRFTVLISTNTVSNPIIEIKFEEHKDTLQQFVAILDIILRNQANYADDKETRIEEKVIYLQEEIRNRHPEIVSEELSKEKERKEKLESSGSGCMVLLFIPIILGGISYFLL